MGTKILTYNVRLNRPSFTDFLRAKNLKSILTEGDWDIIGLCEVYSELQKQTLLENETLKKEYPYRVTSEGTSSFLKYDLGLVILSKHKILDAKIVGFENTTFEPPPFYLLTNKGFIFAELEIDSQSVGVVMLHLHWGMRNYKTELRRMQLMELREFLENNWDLKNTPTIIMGDFNFWDDKNTNESFVMSEIFPEFRDVWSDFHDITQSPGHTWSMQNTFVFLPLKNMRFDFIFTNKKVQEHDIRIVKPISTKLLPPKLQEENLTNLQRTWLGVNLVFQLMMFPLITPLHIYRLARGLPIGIVTRDLSDHYGIEALFDFEQR